MHCIACRLSQLLSVIHSISIPSRFRVGLVCRYCVLCVCVRNKVARHNKRVVKVIINSINQSVNQVGRSTWGKQKEPDVQGRDGGAEMCTGRRNPIGESINKLSALSDRASRIEPSEETKPPDFQQTRPRVITDVLANSLLCSSIHSLPSSIHSHAWPSLPSIPPRRRNQNKTQRLQCCIVRFWDFVSCESLQERKGRIFHKATQIHNHACVCDFCSVDPSSLRFYLRRINIKQSRKLVVV
ncbi:hypothetical protein VTL71DRAFT_11009 [Oculimacula yallundae]|uniref:Uncharacterized protein n=1 Tax=Oculimacula yallundae TaxID=86028 RepID=A0ABR4CUM8_9HELO